MATTTIYSDFKHHRLRIKSKFARKYSDLVSDHERLETSLEQLRQANNELVETYEKTMEGWSRALVMRDRETEGHTQRVTDLAVRLALSMGITGEELTSLRRGALLHDIGKLGIPDRILLKPGPLTEEEWKEMRMHPVYARQMLEPIKFLRSALDIPFYHHEKWDGSGYPYGLKEKQIPLVARIFAIVDVWDALQSKRPYHDAWPVQKARDHILEQSGKHFDPEIVDIFLRTTAAPDIRQHPMNGSFSSESVFS